MTTNTPNGPLRATRFAAWAFVVSGAVMALAPAIGLTAPLDFLVDLVFWPLDGAQSVAAPETRLATGIAGALLTGWGWTLLAISRHALARDGAHGWAWRAMMGGLLCWFVLDGIASLAAGAGGNVLGNLAFLVLMGAPLLLMRGQSRPPAAA